MNEKGTLKTITIKRLPPNHSVVPAKLNLKKPIVPIPILNTIKIEKIESQATFSAMKSTHNSSAKTLKTYQNMVKREPVVTNTTSPKFVLRKGPVQQYGRQIKTKQQNIIDFDVTEKPSPNSNIKIKPIKISEISTLNKNQRNINLNTPNKPKIVDMRNVIKISPLKNVKILTGLKREEPRKKDIIMFDKPNDEMKDVIKIEPEKSPEVSSFEATEQEVDESEFEVEYLEEFTDSEDESMEKVDSKNIELENKTEEIQTKIEEFDIDAKVEPNDELIETYEEFESNYEEVEPNSEQVEIGTEELEIGSEELGFGTDEVEIRIEEQESASEYKGEQFDTEYSIARESCNDEEMTEVPAEPSDRNCRFRIDNTRILYYIDEGSSNVSTAVVRIQDVQPGKTITKKVDQGKVIQQAKHYQQEKLAPKGQPPKKLYELVRPNQPEKIYELVNNSAQEKMYRLIKPQRLEAKQQGKVYEPVTVYQLPNDYQSNVHQKVVYRPPKVYRQVTTFQQTFEEEARMETQNIFDQGFQQEEKVAQQVTRFRPVKAFKKGKTVKQQRSKRVKPEREVQAAAASGSDGEGTQQELKPEEQYVWGEGEEFGAAEVVLTEDHTPLEMSAPYCEVCNIQFSSTKELNKHVLNTNRHKEMRSAILNGCRSCGETFLSMLELYHHIDTEHPGVTYHRRQRSTKIQEPFSCAECDEEIVNRREYWTHFRRFHPGKPWPLRPDSSVTCEECGKYFRCRSLLELHRNVHTGTRQFQCTMCPKSFYTRLSLKYHLISHSDFRPYKCDLCERAFKFKAALQRHGLVHTGERPYICSECGQGFTTLHWTQLHYRKVHRNEYIPYKPRVRARRPRVKPQADMEER